MSIRYAILGLLNEQPMHGYRLKEVFDERVSPLWGLTTGQVYQSLAVLERAALVVSRGERKGRRPARRVYSITTAGKNDLSAWLDRAPATWSRPFREEILIRLMMLRETSVGPLGLALGRQTEDATALLDRIGRLRQQRTGHKRGIDLTGIFLDSMRHHLEADIRNLQLFQSAVEHSSEEHELRGPDAPATRPL